MKRWACLVPMLILVWIVASASSQDPPPAAPKADKAPSRPPTSAEVRKTLDEIIEIPDEFKQPVPFRLVVKYITDKLAAKGLEFPIWIDGISDKDPFEETVVCPGFLRKMSVATVLRICLKQFPGPPCAHYVLHGVIVIASSEIARRETGLNSQVDVLYRAAPIQRILDDMTDRFQVTIIVDSRCADVLNSPFSVRSGDDLTLRGLLESIADSHDLRLIVEEHRVFLTSRANHLRRLRDRVEEAELEKKLRLLDPRSRKATGPVQ